DDHQVDHGDEHHGDPGDGPGQLHVDHRADQHQHHHGAAEDEVPAALAGQEVHVRLAVGVVAQHGGEGQQEHDRRQQDHGPGAEVGLQRLLDHPQALAALGDVGEGHQHDEGRDGAHQQGVEVDAESLDQALLDGMGDRGGGRDIGDRTHTGLIGEHAALDSVDDHRSHTATEHGLRIHGADHDLLDHSGQLAHVHTDHHDAGDQVDPGHDRHHVLRHAGHAA